MADNSTSAPVMRLAALLKHMPAIAFTAGLFVSFPVISQQVIELDGLYNGKNVYIQSPGEGADYCVTSIEVNGLVLTDLPKRPAFEIPLDRQFLTVGDSVHIVIHHQEGCKPKVLHTAGCVFSKKESIDHFTVVDGLLSWTYQNPPAGYRWIVQQYRWDHWDSVGVVTTDMDRTDYFFQVENLHSGDNLFRLIGSTGNARNGLSEELHVPGDHEPVEMTFHKRQQYVVFSTPTYYRLVNEKGQLINEDSSQSFQLSELPKGIYFLLYDNHSARIRL
jgi:hypothetical protein